MDIKVLLVDDSEEIVAYLELMLSNQWHIKTVSRAYNGLMALEIIEEESEAFDLVFVDLYMPEMDGVEFIRELSKRNFRGAIVIISSLDKRLVSLVVDITRQRSLHILGCINKPIGERDIGNILQKYKLLFHEQLSTLSMLDQQQLLDYMNSHYLVPYYQPKINKSNGALHGFEMLARISVPGDANALLPDCFIPVAEAHELIGELSFYLTDVAFEQFADFSKNMGSECKLSINLSPTLLNDPETVVTLEALAKKHDMQPAQIIFEVTEQSAIGNVCAGHGT